MKCKFVVALLSFSFIGCTAMQGSKRQPSSIGVISSKHDVYLYYKSGNNIIVNTCEANTILGPTFEQALTDCNQKVSKVPIEAFKRALRQIVSTKRINLMPLTEEEVKAYNDRLFDAEKYESMKEEIARINNFIKTYGEENAEQMSEELMEAAARDRAIKKLDSEIEKAINLIANNQKLNILKISTDKDKFLYTALTNFSIEKVPCGLAGSIDQRIKDCAHVLSPKKGPFVLVTRNHKLHEVYRDTITGYLWSEQLDSMQDYYGAMKACNSQLDEVGKINAAWRLPTKEESLIAEKNEILLLPNMEGQLHWTSTTRNHILLGKTAYVFGKSYEFDHRRLNGNYYNVSTGGNSNIRPILNVRCVAK